MYASLYRWDGGAMRREWEYLALAPDALAERLTEPVIVVGDGASGIDSPHARPCRLRAGCPRRPASARWASSACAPGRP